MNNLILIKTDIIEDNLGKSKYCIRFTERYQDGGKIVSFENLKDRDYIFDLIKELKDK